MSFAGCSAVRTTGKAIGTVGKVGWKTTKVASKVAWKTGEMTHKGIRSAVYIARGKQVIPLRKENDSMYAIVKLNKKISAKFLVDTGASSMQVSRAMADRLGIKLTAKNQTQVILAGGFTVPAYSILLKEVRLGGARVKNVRAIVLAEDNLELRDGLIGMSFLNHFDFQINPQKPELILQQKVR